MYSKQQASQIKQSFWTVFGQYMRPVPSADGGKVNWSNYKTGIKHIYFRLKVEKSYASISIELNEEQFALLRQLKPVLQGMLGEEWNWEQHTQDENGKPISRVFKELAGVNIFNEADWPRIISFLKPRIIALDAFWSEVRDGFEQII
jgi:hypothetical protein